MKVFFKRFSQIIKNTFWHFPKGIFYNFYYGFPSRKLVLIGITGTDGKTTTSHIIYHSLISAGIKTGLITTIGAKIGEEDITTGLHTTSPDSSVVQKILRRMVDEGLTHAVIEVTAHAIDQYRFVGCHFKIAALTNISHEHLDDFVNLRYYTFTKAKLFNNTDISILNYDDESYKIISKITKSPIFTYSTEQPSDFQANNIKLTSKSLNFSINGIPIKTDSLFRYQVHNILAAYAVIVKLGLDPKTVISTVKHFPDIKGRRQEITNPYQIRALIDYAHTPTGLQKTLESLRQIYSGKLIVIFGATGGRDPSKRPFMGQIVSQNSDVAIITADDTRNERVEDINSQIIKGINTTKKSRNEFKYYNIPNRQDAFNMAVKIAQPGDTIIACGKGHENTILHGKTEYPWSESEAFRTAFRKKYNK